MGNRLLLWDIDGTLINTKSTQKYSLHQRALTPNPDLFSWPKESLSGYTDWQVLEFLRTFSKANSKLASLGEAFENLDRLFLIDVESSVKIECLPGIDEKLFSLASGTGWSLGILTGNTQIRMQTKLLKSNLYAFFEKQNMFYCENGDSREDILDKALQRINKLFDEIIVIGDTPYDIKIAKKFLLKCISVGSGDYRNEELLPLGPDLFLDNFHTGSDAFYSFLRSS